MRKKTVIIYIGLLSLLLSGCLYPETKKMENQVPHPDQIAMVQESVIRFKERTGLLPIHNFDADTPIFEQYIIDFRQLMPQDLSRLPSNSYEDGGVYRYLLVGAEEEQPQVKLIDLRLTQEVGKLQLRVNEYLQRNQFLPVDQIIDENYFTLDYTKLKLKHAPQIKSPYSNHYLPFIVTQEGQVGIDYRLDLYQIMQEAQVHVEEDQDLRFLLVKNSYFVPVHSFPYKQVNGEPVLK